LGDDRGRDHDDAGQQQCGLQQNDAAEEGSPAVRRLRHSNPPTSRCRSGVLDSSGAADALGVRMPTRSIDCIATQTAREERRRRADLPAVIGSTNTIPLP
jgi:hypothetical protein